MFNKIIGDKTMTLTKLSNRSTPSFPYYMDRFLDSSLMTPKFNFAETKAIFPAVNILEKENEFSLEVAAPGLKKEDFRIKYENGQLTISAEKVDENKEENSSGNYTRREFNFQSFERSFKVSEKFVDTSKIEAKYNDGILSLSLPKREEIKPKPAKEISIS